MENNYDKQLYDCIKDMQENISKLWKAHSDLSTYVRSQKRTLIDLANEHPGLIIQVSLNDLVEANQLLIDNTRKNLEQLITDSKAETYLSREKVREMLDVSETTLWRWHQRGYLKSIDVGGKRRYRMSDVKKIMEGEK